MYICSTSAISAGGILFILIHGKGIYKYDPGTSSYTFLSEFPIPDWHCFSVTSANYTVFVCGGKSAGKFCCEFYSFDSRRFIDSGNQDYGNTNLNIWNKETSLTKARRRSALVSIAF